MAKRLASGIEVAVNKVSLYTGSVLVFLMALLVFSEAISRYVFHKSFMISDEFSAYMLVGVVFMGLAYTTREKAHIRVQVVTMRLPTKVRDRLRLATLIIAFVYVSLLSKMCWDLMLFSYKLPARAPTWIQTPEYLPQIFMPVGCTLFSIQLLFEIVRTIRNLHAEEAS